MKRFASPGSSNNTIMKKSLLLGFMLLFFIDCHSQFLMDMLDTTTATGKGLMNVYKNSDHLRFSTYIQPQYQVASAKGIQSFEGGDFSPKVSNRFMLRRSRVRIDFVHFPGKIVAPMFSLFFSLMPTKEVLR